jgi:hypothetical protein
VNHKDSLVLQVSWTRIKPEHSRSRTKKSDHSPNTISDKKYTKTLDLPQKSGKEGNESWTGNAQVVDDNVLKLRVTVKPNPKLEI